MDLTISPYLSVLNQINWQDVNSFNFPDLWVKQWLSEQGSLSELMKKHCQALSVTLLRNDWLVDPQMTKDERVLLHNPDRCFLRQVVLSGDASPWVIGHTLIPQATFQSASCDFSTLEDKPIGELVFRMSNVIRDELQVARVTSVQGVFWARRSRLWIGDYPLLVTELFLPDSPVYR
ncbi:chorismate lyase [Vibrio quintilis]|uniref:Probable chorismate pyruvate-lyase n=1 Tax=Vibrio quintilis TaxID=1117707 RepID=A0A1M7YXF3_9VIBR|nr:chorismate lyase [Vibrio quintilis]SHO57213.1 Chorismate pyruvate-lyase [Vibrio quintilis]